MGFVPCSVRGEDHRRGHQSSCDHIPAHAFHVFMARHLDSIRGLPCQLTPPGPIHNAPSLSMAPTRHCGERCPLQVDTKLIQRFDILLSDPLGRSRWKSARHHRKHTDISDVRYTRFGQHVILIATTGVVSVSSMAWTSETSVGMLSVLPVTASLSGRGRTGSATCASPLAGT